MNINKLRTCPTNRSKCLASLVVDVDLDAFVRFVLYDVLSHSLYLVVVAAYLHDFGTSDVHFGTPTAEREK